MRVCLSFAVMVAGGLAWAPLAIAQAPSANDLIQHLTPGTTRGIHLGPQSPAPPAPGQKASTGRAAKAPMADTAAREGGGEANLSVPFASGSAEISPAAAKVLDELGKALTSPKLAAYKFRVEGHTDTVGAPDMNKTLSEQRANSVADYLVSKFSIDRSRLTPVGMGEENLLVATGPNVPNAANRQVRVITLTQ